jgi:hypothetical protein
MFFPSNVRAEAFLCAERTKHRRPHYESYWSSPPAELICISEVSQFDAKAGAGSTGIAVVNSAAAFVARLRSSRYAFVV